MMFVAAAAAILVALALVITRAIKGPTVFDRVQIAPDSFVTIADMSGLIRANSETWGD